MLVRMLYSARKTDPSLSSEKIGDYSYTKGGSGTQTDYFMAQAAFVSKWGRIK